MNPRFSLLSLLLVLGAALPPGARAEPRPEHGPAAMAEGAAAPGRHGGELPPPAGPFIPPFLLGLKLSEAQQDKLFDLFLAQARPLRDKTRALDKAEAELRAADPSEESRLVPLVEARARAWADLAQLRLRHERQALVLLTPEQRRQVEEGRAGRPAPGRPDCRGDGRRG